MCVSPLNHYTGTSVSDLMEIVNRQVCANCGEWLGKHSHIGLLCPSNEALYHNTTYKELRCQADSEVGVGDPANRQVCGRRVEPGHIFCVEHES